MDASAFVRGLLDDQEDPQLASYDPQGGWNTAKQAGSLLASMTTPGAVADAAGYLGGPSVRENVGAGNYGDAALQALGLIPGAGLLGKAAVGAKMAIVPALAAKGLKVEKALPKTEMFARAVENTPGARIEDGSLVMPVARRQMSVQHNQPSVRGGVFYLPEGDKRLSYYNGTGYYGGQDKIAGETAFNNPLFVKGATGGKAPEAAFATLSGKDAMKKLDRDVFSAVNERHWMSRQDPDIYRERVGNLLADYGADPDIADYLIRNSSQGNQLRYALQENIIGNAVRNAGHDAVLGYSLKRSKRPGGDPFLSEIFDVRESHYPGKNGEYQIWDNYKPASLL
jgi:hypothetical protein